MPVMSDKTDRVRALYLEGIRDGDLTAVERYTGDRYVQHSTGVADGRAGFQAFFKDFLQRHPHREIEVIRCFADGPYVFAHAYQRLNGGAAQWVTMDLFLLDENDLIVEHWDCIDAFTGVLTSGHTQIDGPTEPVDLQNTQANKAVVADMLGTVFQPGADPEQARRYISAECYVQHSEGLADGVDALIDGLHAMRAGGRETAYDVRYLVGCGSFVVTLSQVDIGNEQRAAFDLFHLKDRLIIEHWDVVETIGPPETWNNSGKF